MKSDLANIARGTAMGCADVVPGVSGGTVALVLGIYERLVTALSNVDGQWIGLIRTKQWRKAAQHIDLRFLFGLAIGVVCGFVVMTLAMNAILKSPGGRLLLLAAFFGMILASSLLVARMLRPANPRQHAVAWLLGAIGFALTLSLLWVQRPEPNSAAAPTLPFIFCCGATAICAMILPGISGAMVLLLWGVYAYLADIPHQLLEGHDVPLCLQTIAVFGAGCLIGLLAFAKLLRWLLAKYHTPTLALLVGVMVGALPQIWPFQNDLTPDEPELKFKQFERVWPDAWTPEVTQRLVVALVAGLAVLGFHLLQTRLRKPQ